MNAPCYCLHVGNSHATLVSSTLKESSRNRFRLFDYKLLEEDEAIILLSLSLSDEFDDEKIGREILPSDDDLNPHRLVTNIANLIINGKQQRDDNHIYSPYRALQFMNSREEIEIEIGNGITVSPLDLYLKIMKTMLERNCANMKNRLAIAVPDYFPYEVYQLIRKKVSEWGYNVMNVYAESRLSLIAYSLFFPSMDDKKALYLDVGQSLKIGAFSIDEGQIFKERFYRNDELGGEAITLKMMEYCDELFKRESKYSIQENPLSMIKLRRACEEAKAKLSDHDSWHLHIPKFYNNIDLNIPEFSKSLFEELTLDVINRLIVEILEFMNKETFEYIIVCGKSTRIPKLKEMIRKLISTEQPEAEICDWIECPIELGGCIESYISNDPNILMNDNTCCNYGISNENGEMIVIVPRTSVPYSKTQTISIPLNGNEKFISIDIYEGNRKFVKDCEKIGTLRLDIPDNYQGAHFEVELIFELFFSLNLNMIVSARSPTYGTEDSFIPSRPVPLKPEEIEELLLQMASDTIPIMGTNSIGPPIDDLD